MYFMVLLLSIPPVSPIVGFPNFLFLQLVNHKPVVDERMLDIARNMNMKIPVKAPGVFA